MRIEGDRLAPRIERDGDLGVGNDIVLETGKRQLVARGSRSSPHPNPMRVVATAAAAIADQRIKSRRVGLGQVFRKVSMSRSSSARVDWVVAVCSFIGTC